MNTDTYTFPQQGFATESRITQRPLVPAIAASPVWKGVKHFANELLEVLLLLAGEMREPDMNPSAPLPVSTLEGIGNRDFTVADMPEWASNDMEVLEADEVEFV